MPQISSVDQFFNTLRADRLNIRALKRLLTADFLIELINEPENPSKYHWNSILEAITYLSEEEREALIDQASENLREPLLSYLMRLLKNNFPIDIQFSLGLLDLVSEPKRAELLKPKTDPNNVLNLALTHPSPQYSFVPLLAKIPEEDRMAALNTITFSRSDRGPTLFRKVLTQVSETHNIELLKQIWELLPAEERIEFLTTEIEAHEYDPSFLQEISSIFSQEELDQLNAMQPAPNALVTAIQKNPVDLTPAFDKLEQLGLFGREELNVAAQNFIFELMIQPDFLIRLCEEAKKEDRFHDLTKAFEVLTKEQRSGVFYLELHLPSHLPSTDTVGPLAYFLIQGAPAKCIESLIQLIPERELERYLSSNYLSPIYQALSGHQKDIFLRLVEELNSEQRWWVIDWLHILEMEYTGIGVFEPLWTLLPPQERINYLTYLPSQQFFTENPWMMDKVLTLILKTLSAEELGNLNQHPSCPTLWKELITLELANSNNKNHIITVHTVHQSVDAALHTIKGNLSNIKKGDYDIVLNNKDLGDDATPLPLSVKEMLLYLLTKHAGVDEEEELHSSIQNNLFVFTPTNIGEVPPKEKEEAIRENKLHLEVVHKFLQDPEQEKLTLFLPIVEIYKPYGKSFQNEATKALLLEPAVFTFIKSGGKLTISIYANSIGYYNKNLLKEILEHFVAPLDFEVEIVEEPMSHPKSANDLLYSLHYYLQASLGEAYTLELTPELINTIRKELHVMLLEGEYRPSQEEEALQKYLPQSPGSSSMYAEERWSEDKREPSSPESLPDRSYDDNLINYSALNQFLKILREDNPDKTEKIRELFDSECRHHSFLNHLIQASSAPYHYQSILEGLTLFSEEEQQQFLDDASRTLDKPLLEYLFTKGFSAKKFALALLDFFPKTQLWHLIEACWYYFLEEPELIIDLLTPLSEEDRLTCLMLPYHGEIIFNSLIKRFSQSPIAYASFEKVWKLIPENQRINLLISPKVLNQFYFSASFAVLMHILSQDELEQLKNLEGEEGIKALKTAATRKLENPDISRYPNTQLLDQMLIKSQDEPGIKRDEPLEENPFQYQVHHNQLKYLFFKDPLDALSIGIIGKMEPGLDEPTIFFADLIDEALVSDQWDSILSAFKQFSEEERLILLKGRGFNLLVRMIKGAPAAFIKDLLELIPVENRRDFILDGSMAPLREALISNPFTPSNEKVFFIMLNSLPNEARLEALNNLHSIITMEEQGHRIFRKLWDLLPKSSRLNYLIEKAFTDEHGNNFFKADFFGYRSLVLMLQAALTPEELQAFSEQFECPDHWRTSLEQVLTDPEASRTTLSLQDINRQTLIPFQAGDRDDFYLYFYLLTKHAQLEPDQQFNTLFDKFIQFTIVTTRLDTEADNQKLEKAVEANSHLRTLVEEYFDNNPEGEELCLNLVLQEIERLNFRGEIGGIQPLYKVALIHFKTDTKENSKVTIHLPSLGEHNFQLIMNILTRLFPYMECIGIASQVDSLNREHSIVERVHKFLQVSLGEQYQLELSPEKMKEIQREASSLESSENWSELNMDNWSKDHQREEDMGGGELQSVRRPEGKEMEEAVKKLRDFEVAQLAKRQYIKILRENKPNLKEDITKLFHTEYNDNHSFLAFLIKSAGTPYDYHSIMEGLALFSFEEQREFLGKAFHVFSPSLLQLLAHGALPEKQFAVYLLSLYPMNVRWSMLNQGSTGSLEGFLYPPKLFLELLSSFSEKDRIEALCSRGLRVFGRIVNTNLDLLEKVWKLLPKDERIDFLNSDTLAREIDPRAASLICTILSPEELSTQASDTKEGATNLHLQQAAQAILKRHPRPTIKKKLSASLEEGSSLPFREYFFRGQDTIPNTSFLSELIIDALKINEWDDVIEALKSLSEEERLALFTTSKILDLLVQNEAPPELFKDLLELINLENRSHLILPEDQELFSSEKPLEEALRSRQFPSYYAMLAALPKEERKKALQNIPLIVQSVQLELPFFKTLWDLLPEVTRLDDLIEEAFSNVNYSFLPLLEDTLTKDELKVLKDHSDCPRGWKAYLEQVLAEPNSRGEKLCLQDILNRVSTFYKDKLLCEFLDPSEMALAFLAKQAEMDPEELFNPDFKKMVPFFTITHHDSERVDETTIDSAIEANAHFRDRVMDYFSNNPRDGEMVMFVSLQEIIETSPKGRVMNKASLQNAVFKFRVDGRRLEISIYHHFLGNSNFEVLNTILSRIFPHSTCHEIVIPQMSSNSDGILEVQLTHTYLQASLGDRYTLNFTEEMFEQNLTPFLEGLVNATSESSDSEEENERDEVQSPKSQEPTDNEEPEDEPESEPESEPEDEEEEVEVKPIIKNTVPLKAAQRFEAQLENITKKANNLRGRGFSEAGDYLADSFGKNLSDGFEAYRDNRIGKEEFRTLCYTEFKTAKESDLKDHRDLLGKNFFLNIALAIGLLGIGYVVAGLICNGKDLFFSFNTDSINVVEKTEEIINEICPGVKAGG